MVARRLPALAAIARIGRGPRGWLRDLGPGLITGAADDDPSGIVTYSPGGGGVRLHTWLVCRSDLAVHGRRAGDQCASRTVTGCGLAASLKRHAPAPLLASLVTLLVIADVINLGADIGPWRP